jgi:hypothetical protein
MVSYNPLQSLPSTEELPDSDDTSVDYEVQTLVPDDSEGNFKTRC